MRRAILPVILLTTLWLSAVEPPGVEVESGEALALPEWAAFPPMVGDFTLGLAWKSDDPSAMSAEAREFAAVQRSRNRSSYNVAKYARVKTESENAPGDELMADFEVNVSTTPPSQATCDSLAQVDSLFVDGYYLALFRMGDTPTPAPNDRVGVAALSFDPSARDVREEGEYVWARVCNSSQDLIDAYSGATRLARLELARYCCQRVEGTVRSESWKVSKAWSQETVLRLEDVAMTRLSVERKRSNNIFTYTVAVEMRMKRP